MTRRQLNALLRQWQDIKRLQDWDITVTFVSSEKLEGDLGKCFVYETRKAADIWLLDPAEPNTNDSIPRDIEADLVHELDHVCLWMVAPADWESPLGILLEQVIEQNALALVRLKRAAGTKNKKRR